MAAAYITRTAVSPVGSGTCTRKLRPESRTARTTRPSALTTSRTDPGAATPLTMPYDASNGAGRWSAGGAGGGGVTITRQP